MLTLDQGFAIKELVTIKDRDPDTMTDADYDARNNLAEFLFDTVSIHDAFSHRHPEFCLSTVLWMFNWGPVQDLPDNPNLEGKIYTLDYKIGGRIDVQPKTNNLMACLSDAMTEPNGFYLYFDGHSNIIWLDSTNKVIHRYDPQMSKDVPEAKPIDSAVAAFFLEILPNYTYLGNTLNRNQCIQDVRWRERKHLDCFCQEYTLLYANNRLQGMNHEAAAEDLVNSRHVITHRIADFYTGMVV